MGVGHGGGGGRRRLVPSCSVIQIAFTLYGYYYILHTNACLGGTNDMTQYILNLFFYFMGTRRFYGLQAPLSGEERRVCLFHMAVQIDLSAMIAVLPKKPPK